jgi:hypothetical protein
MAPPKPRKGHSSHMTGHKKPVAGKKNEHHKAAPSRRGKKK